MPTWEYGFRRALTVVIIGFLAALILGEFLESFGIPYSLILFLLGLISILGIMEIMDKMTYWSLSYLFGWLSGLIVSFILLYSFLSKWEMILYFTISIIILLQKIKRGIG